MAELIRANQDVFMINDSAFMVDEGGNIYRAVPPVFREAFLDEPSSGPRPTLSPVEQVVVAVVLTALLARLWRLW